MNDNVTIIVGQIITGVVTIVTLLITLLLKAKQNKIDANQTTLEKQQSILHEQINGHMTKLLEVTASNERQKGNTEGQLQRKEESAPQNELNILAAKAEGKAEAKAESIKKLARTLQVFVLDDSKDDLDLVSKQIERLPGMTYKFYTDEELLIKNATQEPNIYIVDHSLTKGTGLGILAALKKLNVLNFYIGFSGVDDDKLTIQYLNKGADRFLDKSNPDYIKLMNGYVRDGVNFLNNL